MASSMTTEWMVQELFGPEGEKDHPIGLSLEELRELGERLTVFANPKDTIATPDGREWLVTSVRDKLTTTIETVVTMNFGYHVIALAQELEKTGELRIDAAIHMIVISWIASTWERYQLPEGVADNFADFMTANLGQFSGLLQATPFRKEVTDHVVAETAYLESVMEEKRLSHAVEETARHLNRTMHLPDLSKLLRKLDTARAERALHLAKMKRCENPD